MLSFRVSYYNSHPRMGMNDRLLDSNADWYSFQPTPPHGDEQTIVVQVSVFVELQPASLHRDERNNLIKNQLYRIFSSHPVRDEPLGLQLALDMYYYNPHPPYGYEHLWVCKTIHNSYFNPHPRIEVNFHLLLPVSEIQSFNPHPRMGMNSYR